MKKTLITLAVASALLGSLAGVSNTVNADDNNTGAAANVNTKTYNLSNSKANSLTLANADGNLTKNDTAVLGNNKAIFSYKGYISKKLNLQKRPFFIMNLLFTPVSW